MAIAEKVLTRVSGKGEVKPGEGESILSCSARRYYEKLIKEISWVDIQNNYEGDDNLKSPGGVSIHP
ncbi:MAG: hypothetical protein AB1502_16625 [Thermodesulfobacteriota bacterium]